MKSEERRDNEIEARMAEIECLNCGSHWRVNEMRIECLLNVAELI